MLVEGVITLIIVAALFYVAPGVLNAVVSAAPVVPAADVALNASQATIGTTAAGALNLSSIGLIMLGIGIMIGGFALIKGYGR